MLRLKSIAKGIGSYALESFRNPHQGAEGSFSAEGCYATFMRYIYALAHAGTSFDGKSVLEFGPGASLGMGIAALMCGATRYYAFDLIDHTADQRNLDVFEKLAVMFKARAPIPMTGFCARIFPFIGDSEFPHQLLSDELLERSLAPDRLSTLRSDLASHGGEFVRTRFASSLGAADIDEPVDIILSESVLEHVDDLASAYQAFGRWLSNDGVMVHLIDFSSHGLASTWNGHWSCSPILWKLARGKRHFLINRVPLTAHLSLLGNNGFEVIHSEVLRRVDGAIPEQFSGEFGAMSLRDATTHLATLVCHRVAATKHQL